MFHNIPPAVMTRMTELEEIDRQDRTADIPRLQRLRQIPASTGKFLTLLAAESPHEGSWVEIGTSAGYSTLWLSLACRICAREFITFEILPEKAALARETLQQTGLEDIITLVQGDARSFLKDYKKIAFCFLDAEKDVYADCYDLVIPRLVPGGLLVADNAISHEFELSSFLRQALSDERVDALVVPIGNGELVCRRL